VSDLVGVLIVIAVSVAVALPILFSVRRSLQTHDPEKAHASTGVLRDGAFELTTLAPAGGTVWLRFVIDGADTDGEYDLVVTGEVKPDGGASQAFARKTLPGSKLPAATGAEVVGSTFAATLTTASFELATLPAGVRCVVRGTVHAGAPTRLARGWVYVLV
jgi:hypothetical protein